MRRSATEYWERTSEQCWRTCDKKGGKCSDCGKNGFCCRNEDHPTWNGNCPTQAIKAASKDKHDCVSPKKGFKNFHNNEIEMEIISFGGFHSTFLHLLITYFELRFKLSNCVTRT